MERLKATPTSYAILKKRHAASAFKVCPLCEALNVKENTECFVCRWSGEFDTGPAYVGARLQEVFDRCPELGTMIQVEGMVVSDAGWRLWWGRLRRLFSRRLDIRA